MQTLNLINESKSDIKYHLLHFPDGEVQIVLGDINVKETVRVICRITSAEELFILAQACDILNRNGLVYDLHILYLMSMRMDRVMDFNRPFSLKIVSDIIKSFGARYICALEPHSERTEIELLDSYISSPIDDMIDKMFSDYNPSRLLVFPDSGARYRYWTYSDLPTISFCKKRDLETGKIISIEPENEDKRLIDADEIIILDDLCDAGGTFVAIADYIRKVNNHCTLNIAVTHMVNKKGIDNLSAHFDKVWFTDSYKDWNKELGKLPKNVIQISAI